MRRLPISIAFAVHGLVHLLGFTVYWKLAEFKGLAYPSSLLGGRLDASSGLVRGLGVLWLVADAGFLIGALGLALARPWWPSAILGVALLSLALCALGWPDARVGAYVDIVILAALAIRRWVLPNLARRRAGAAG